MKLDELLNQELLEVLDKPLPYKVKRSDELNFEAEFVAGDRKIIFAATNMWEPYEGEDDEDLERDWNIEFEEKKGYAPATQDLTGSGEEFKVFATILAIIDRFIKVHKPLAMRFNASKIEKNRVRLYRRMLKTQMPTEWKVREYEDSHAVVFLLSKK